eukprot:CAMPEP_0194190996 /NCGR_PEP_ID=MMETSP0154-20130528/65114_1 /TAXON_ID=1049557 /ORGANISM="Thalassiothrix antarctica, Strain L6-D1" /LENGTH=147 /DNA_ID=CAMNT_0038913315 /DNA_START=1 /DNA_END=441 /DNA_ORIENTATION=+
MADNSRPWRSHQNSCSGGASQFPTNDNTQQQQQPQQQSLFQLISSQMLQNCATLPVSNQTNDDLPPNNSLFGSSSQRTQTTESSIERSPEASGPFLNENNGLFNFPEISQQQQQPPTQPPLQQQPLIQNRATFDRPPFCQQELGSAG